MIWLVGLVALGILATYIGGQWTKARAEQAHDGTLFHWPPPKQKGNPDDSDFEDVAYAVDVVGESNYRPWLEQLLGAAAPGEIFTRAVLVPESTNPHDAQAVRVDIDGKPVGYLSRDDARTFRRRLRSAGQEDRRTTCDAVVGGGGTNHRGKAQPIGVRLNLAPFY